MIRFGITLRGWRSSSTSASPGRPSAWRWWAWFARAREDVSTLVPLYASLSALLVTRATVRGRVSAEPARLRVGRPACRLWRRRRRDVDSWRRCEPRTQAAPAVAEQYWAQPPRRRLALVASGAGRITQAQVSVCHGYHGMSLLRRFRARL